jgi:hypothetical protein
MTGMASGCIKICEVGMSFFKSGKYSFIASEFGKGAGNRP